MEFFVRQASCARLPLRFSKPFRFGDFTLDACPQLLTRLEVATPGGLRAVGMAAELAVPRWFDKRACVAPERNVADLETALVLAADVASTMGGPHSLLALHDELQAALAKRAPDLPALVRSFGVAQVEKAVIDGICRMTGSTFAQATRDDLWGLREAAGRLRCSPDQVGALLAAMVPSPSIHLRHTVGHVVDPAQRRASLDALAAELRSTNLLYLKIKLAGNPAEDAEWVSEVLEAAGPLHYSLDGNEQYRSVDELQELCDRLALDGILGPCLYLEQPLAREDSLRSDVHLQRLPLPVVIDEADDHDTAFAEALGSGHLGVSSKACKGPLRALMNMLRCSLAPADRHGRRPFVTPEDLCTQAGWALQQDLALAALTGSVHAEKNGHQYVEPFAGMPASWARRFALEHPDLYASREDGRFALRVESGQLALQSVHNARGFGTSFVPSSVEFAGLLPIPAP